jgi:hypothetical protein
MPLYRLLKDLRQPGRHLLAGVVLDTEATSALTRLREEDVARWTAQGWIAAIPEPAPDSAHDWPTVDRPRKSRR